MKINHKAVCFALWAVMGLALSVPAQQITTIGEINTVDADGNPTFPGIQTSDRYTIEGIALNDIAVFNGQRQDGGTDTSLVLFAQDDSGGIQVYSGSWYGGGLAGYPDVKQGDRIRVTGLTGFYGGKTNINDRHNADQRFDITILGSGVDIAPIPLDDLTAATEFDQTRQTGGECYQGRLVVLRNVEIVDGAWEPGGTVIVQDTTGGRLPVVLWHATGIGDQPKPQGTLDIVGVFNQDDIETPATEEYQLWPRSINDFVHSTKSDVLRWEAYR